MSIEISILLSTITVVVGVLTYVLNKNKSTKENTDKKVREAVEKATADAKISTKLDAIIQNLSEIRLDSRETNKTIKVMSEKLTKVEQKVEMHDELLQKLEKYHH